MSEAEPELDKFDFRTPGGSVKYTTHNEKNIAITGGSLQGGLTATYDNLVTLFGPGSDESDWTKCDAEWQIEFEDGTVACVYNWKNGRNYNGPSGTPVEEITRWNIGGPTKRSAQLVTELFVG